MDDLVLQHASETDEDFLMYTSTFCPYCVAAKRLFASKGLLQEITSTANAACKRRWSGKPATGRSRSSSISEASNPCSSVV